jgi:hypothetical protein
MSLRGCAPPDPPLSRPLGRDKVPLGSAQSLQGIAKKNLVLADL